MAEAKKDDKKGVKKAGIGLEDVFLLILGLITIFFVIIPRFDDKENTNTQDGSQSTINIPALYDRLFNEHVDGNIREPSLIDETKFRITDIIKNITYGFAITAIFFSLLFWILKNYFEFKLKIIKEEYAKNIGIKKIVEEIKIEDREIPKDYVPDTNGLRNPKWEMIETYARSGNQAELRLAIIEADIMLFDVLKQSGFKGETIGDILKNTNKSQLATLDHAWRAHKVRNDLAHQGSSFVLGRTDAEAALEGYRKVFTELNLI